MNTLPENTNDKNPACSVVIFFHRMMAWIVRIAARVVKRHQEFF